MLTFLLFQDLECFLLNDEELETSQKPKALLLLRKKGKQAIWKAVGRRTDLGASQAIFPGEFHDANFSFHVKERSNGGSVLCKQFLQDVC